MKRILLSTLGILLAIGIGPHASAQKPKAKATPAVTPRAVGLDGTLTWSGAVDQTWANGEIVGFADMNEIKTEVDACFSSQDGGTFSAGNMSITGNFSAVAGAFTGAVTAPSFTADASATPQLIFDDSVDGDATAESIVRGNAVATDNGRVELLVESTDGVYKGGVTLCSTTGVAKTILGPGVDADGVSPGIGTCLTPTGDGFAISEAGAMTAIGSATLPATALSGTIPSANLATANRTRICDFNIETPVMGDDGLFQCEIPVASTLVRVYCNTVGAGTTTTIQIYSRAEATPSTGTTGLLSSNLVCDDDGASSTSFATGGGLTARTPLAVGIKAITTSTLVRVHAEFTVD